MADVLRALSISGGILLLVVVFIILISIVVVKRGEGEAAEIAVAHAATDVSVVPKATGPAAPAKGGKAAAESDEISVINMLLLGTGLFVLTVILLLGVSLLQHLG